MDDVDAFNARTREDGECLIWTGYINKAGHPIFITGGRRARRNLVAHRFAYELAHGPIPSGMVVQQTCGRSDCVRPGHLVVARHPGSRGRARVRSRCASRRPAIDRFRDKVVVDEISGCHVWIAGRDRLGYARFQVGAKSCLAHKWIWEQLHGPVPDGLELDHTCRNRACVNVEHLEPVTHAENMRRAEYHLSGMGLVNAAKTRCVHGHPYDEANTYVTRRGTRACRRCNSISSTASHRRARKRDRELSIH